VSTFGAVLRFPLAHETNRIAVEEFVPTRVIEQHGHNAPDLCAATLRQGNRRSHDSNSIVLTLRSSSFPQPNVGTFETRLGRPNGADLNENRIKERLQQAQREGELGRDVNAADYARYIATIMIGMGIQAVNGAVCPVGGS
jgi:hypothetical protein